MREWVRPLALVLLAIAARAPQSAAEIPGHGKSARTLQAGTLTLHRCDTPAPWCGRLTRPFDPTGAVPGMIAVYFEFYPHRAAGKRTGMLVATEGGPGYPATESRDEYLALFDPLRDSRDVLIMDNRGTGRSAAVDCAALQTDPAITEDNVAECGRSLGSKALLYSAAYAADDLDGILSALGSGPIDLYGDSYGTFFSQVFAVRHPDRVRSLILDGAYPLDAPGLAWAPNYAPAMREKFNLTCQRSESCSQFAGSSLEHIAPALEILRLQPAQAEAPDEDGRLQRFTADATQLAVVMFGSAPAYATVRELDAAARAYAGGDRAPLWRLMAESHASMDSRDETRNPAKFSAGLAAAVMCQDAPQIFDMALEPGPRVAARDRAIAERSASAPDTYAPFKINEYRGMPLDYTFIDECVKWPAVSKRLVNQDPGPAYPGVPVLVISGDLDNMTPLGDGTMAANAFPHGRQIVVPNGFHVNALPHSRSECPADIARHFIETLEPGDTACLGRIPEVRLFPRFARRLAELDPARPLEGNAVGASGLRVAAGAVLTVADVIDRIGSNSSGRGVGLRGGRFTIERTRHGHRVTLQSVCWTGDLAVSGRIDWPGRSGTAFADLRVAGPPGLSGPLQVRWSEGEPKARAEIRGSLGRARVAAEAPAP